MQITTPVEMTNARYPDGSFAPKTDICAVTMVALPRGVIGWRVGPGGRIYANREHAVAYAKRRAEYFGTAK
jgi:hypothetical protein